MAKKKLTAKIFAGWLTAPEVATKIYGLGGHDASIGALYDRLKVGLVKAAAEHRAVNEGDLEDGPIAIPEEHWKNKDGILVDDIWQTGQVTIWATTQGWHGRPRIDYYGVRFDPRGIEAMLSAAGGTNVREALKKALAKPKPTTIEDQQTAPAVGPPVPAAALQAWAGAYKLAFTGQRDTLDNAYKSAAGAFPGMSYSRQQIRDLVGGGRKKGPKGARKP